MIEWDSKYSVNVLLIDEEHKKFIDIINKVIVAKEHRNNRKEILGILNKINEYAQKHFKTEETYMEKFGYSDYLFHKKEHQEFSLAILSLRIKLTNSNYQIANDIYIFLQRWLVKHIQKTDQKYTDCFNKNGLK
jgi:hemerythrin-like metal-binding protein